MEGNAAMIRASCVNWPAALPGLGPRSIGPFVECRDCAAGDWPPVVTVRVAGETMSAPGPRWTFARFGGVPVCARHARQRAIPSAVVEVLDLLDGVIVERLPR
jgi:hypothetical protein